MVIEHHAPHVLHQTVIKVARRQRGGGSALEQWGDPEPAQFRGRITKAASSVFGGGDLRHHRPIRPDAELTPEQLWQVYKLCGDVRSAVDSIVRRVSTQDRRVRPSADPAADEEAYRAGLAQAAAVAKRLARPNDDDDWRTFWTKVGTDALVFWHGAFEHAYGRKIDGRTLKVTQGKLEEFVPVYGPSLHPVQDQAGRITNYVQDQAGAHGYHGAGDSRNQFVALGKHQISRLVLAPNTRSPYMVPIIETIVREVTTLVRASERAMYTMDRSEVPSGFLVLTGMPPKASAGVQEGAEHYAGNGHKLRVLHSMGATAPAQWLRIQETFKEVEFASVIRETRKSVWRNFGVTPIEQGDTEDANRSSSQVQLEVGSSHLVEPLLEAMAQIVNTRMIPDLVGGEDRVLCVFEFVGDESLTPEDEKLIAEASEVRLRSGQSTLNEERAEQGKPRVAGGDVVRVGGLPIDGGEVVEDDDAGEVDEIDADALADDSDADTSSEASRSCGCPPHLHGVQPHAAWALLDTLGREANRARRQRRAVELLPSEWQPAGRFAGLRTIDLVELFDEVTRYREQVDPLWADARREVLAVTGAAWRAGTIGNSEHLRLIGESFAQLRTEWSATTRVRYLETAELGALSAQDVSGNDAIGAGARDFGLAYYEQATTYLDALIDDVRTRVGLNVQAVRAAYRAPQKADERLGPQSELVDLLEAVEHSFDANEHRIDNWSGRLVELGSLAMLQALLEDTGGETPTGEVVEGGPEAGGDDGTATQPAGLPGDPGSGGTEWWVSWEYVGDDAMCATCEREGALPIRRASTLSTVPGGATECGPRCRCVLVYWTRAEVHDGTAQKLTP